MKKLLNVKKNINHPVHEKWYEKRLVFKTFICLVYLIVITMLLICIYQLYEEKKEILPWDEAQTVEDYTYITISRMSEKFAYYEKSNKEIHFVIEEEDTGQWHTYLIAIDADDYDKYKDIIDYTYERTTEMPEPITVYGYPVLIDEELKELAIQNITNFVPAENEVVITDENFNTYLTNSYLDTTIPKQENFSMVLCLVIIMLIIVVLMFILTIFDQDKKVYQKVEDVYYGKKKQLFSVRK
jgi:short subunit fatty acids transporter